MRIFNIKTVIILLLFISCEKLGLRSIGKFSFDIEPHTSNLRTNGIYFGGTAIDIFGDKVVEVIILYNNGVSLGPGSSTRSDLDQLLSSSLLYESRDNWGIFKIEGDSITQEQWFPGMGGNPVLSRSGRVLSDTTFIFTRSKLIDTGGQIDVDEEIEQLFTFRQYSPKPDSTNNFIN